MKIQIISDLHQEFGVSLLDFTDIDLLIIAGDLGIGVKGIEWLKARVKDISVIYVIHMDIFMRDTMDITPG